MNDRIYVNNLSRKNKLARLAWTLVDAIFFKTTPRWALNSWRVFLLKLFGARIGIGSRVLPSCSIWAPWNLQMGIYSVLGEGVDCYNMDIIVIGDYSTISQRAFLCGGSHDIRMKNLPLITRPVIIGSYVWVCAEAFIHPGVSIGDYSVVSGRSVVTKDIEQNIVVSGNPAKFLKSRSIIEG